MAQLSDLHGRGRATEPGETHSSPREQHSARSRIKEGKRKSRRGGKGAYVAGRSVGRCRGCDGRCQPSYGMTELPEAGSRRTGPPATPPPCLRRPQATPGQHTGGMAARERATRRQPALSCRFRADQIRRRSGHGRHPWPHTEPRRLRQSEPRVRRPLRRLSHRRCWR